MKIGEIKKFIESTSDSAFAVDCSGLVVAWNAAAEEFFGKKAVDAIGKPCGQLIQGIDECGPVCARDCSIQQAVRRQQPVRNFDLKVKTANGYQWCNFSILVTEAPFPTASYSIHIVRAISAEKRLEILFRDLVQNRSLPEDRLENKVVPETRSPLLETDLTRREIQILRFLAKGVSGVGIAAQLHISRTTVNNHVQHILRKLDAHSRLEAIRRAEYAGLI